uniref:Uncharacterized protein n=1 Tax=Arundo donax TaxID=35708 RepID=A0A0A9GN37_ARUDO
MDRNLQLLISFLLKMLGLCSLSLIETNLWLYIPFDWFLAL